MQPTLAGASAPPNTSIHYRPHGHIVNLTPGMQAQNDRVELSLGMMHEISRKMSDCGTDRGNGNFYYCRHPQCMRCVLEERRLETRQAIRKTFAGLDNDDLAFVTILMPVTKNISEVWPAIKKHKAKFRSAIDERRRKRGAAWDKVQMVGWWELDRYTDTEFHALGRNTQHALEDLNAPLIATGRTVWRPHLHAIVALGGVTPKDIKEMFEGKGYNGRHQVLVEPFDTRRPVNMNLQTLVRYCLKMRLETDYKRTGPFDPDYHSKEGKDRERHWWPLKDIKTHGEWLNEPRSGFQSLKFTIGVSRKERTDSKDNEEVINETSGIGNDCDGVSGSAGVSGVLGVEDKAMGVGHVKQLLEPNWLHQIAQRVRERHAQSQSSSLQPDNSGFRTGPHGGYGGL